MERHRFHTATKRRLTLFAKKHKIIGDVFPFGITPTADLSVNFPGFNWLGAFGSPIGPEHCLFSPEIVISTGTKEPGLYTLLMIDLGKEGEKIEI